MKTLMKIGLWTLAFVPLIVDNSVFFPFISGKMLLVRVAITLVAILFLIHFYFRKDFRNEIYARIKKIYKNPLVLSLLAFMGLFLVSTIFAVDKFRAFYGDIERGEGFLGVFFFFSFFIFSILLFNRKDWGWFFKLTLVSALILVIKEFAAFFSGTVRPGVDTGNPTFLAGFLLFSIASSIIVFNDAKKYSQGGKISWRIFSTLTLLLSIAGIFITETRGSILGLIAGIFLLIIYGAVKGKDQFVFNRINLRKVSLSFLIVLVVIGGAFISTKKAGIWQKVPGFNRLAEISLSNDSTTQTRLIAIGVGLKAINPANDGYGRFLVGWGMENFSVAYNKYYNPKYYFYEHTWFDRAHNKLMDVLVMNGLLGLLSYLAIWASFLWLVFRKKEFSSDKFAMLFFGGAFFVHLLFVFDQVSTYIPFFAFLSFLTFSSNPEQPEGNHNKVQKAGIPAVSDGADYAAFSVLTVGTLFYIWAVIFAAIIPYSQMAGYLGMLSSGNASVISDNIDSVLTPYTYAQENIRTHFLSITTNNYGKDPVINSLFDKSLAKMEELLQNEPYNPRYFIQVGQAYEIKARTDKNAELFKKAESYYRQAYALAPLRQDVIYALAGNLINQGRFDEGIGLLRQSLASDDRIPETHYYLGMGLILANQNQQEALNDLEFALNHNGSLGDPSNKTADYLYQRLAKYFYDKKDMADFLTVTLRLQKLEPDKSSDYQKAIDLLNKNKWPVISF